MKLLASAQFAPCSRTDHPRDLIRRDARTLYEGRPMYETFAPGCWSDRGRGAELQLGHDGPAIGHVAVIIDRAGWHICDLLVELDDDDPLVPVVRERLRVGAPVSVGCLSSDCREDPDWTGVGTVRHTEATLDHIALLARGEHPGFADARVTTVRELKPEPKLEPAAYDAPAVREDSPPRLLRRDCGSIVRIR